MTDQTGWQERCELARIVVEMALPGVIAGAAVLEMGGHFWAITLTALAVAGVNARLVVIGVRLEVLKLRLELDAMRRQEETV
jgi:hypothetical protein